jgi:hypothetical protein
MPIDRSAIDPLTEGQRRHLVASLANVVAALGEIDSIARRRGPTPAGSLARIVDDLPPGFDSAIELPLTRARAELAALIATLDLQAPDASAYRSVQALVMSSLVVLEDTGTRNLRGYGEIYPSLPELLEPALSRIHEQVRAIGQALAAPASRGQPQESTP